MNQAATAPARPWDRPFWKPVRRKEGVFAFLLIIHVLAILGIILFPLPRLKVLGLAALFIAFGGLGTTVCYHRMLAHKTLKTNRFIEQTHLAESDSEVVMRLGILLGGGYLFFEFVTDLSEHVSQIDAGCHVGLARRREAIRRPHRGAEG